MPDDFEALIRAHRDHVFLYLMKRTHQRETAEDLTQETLARAHSAFAQFDPARGPFKAWIFSIAHNLMVNHFEAAGRRIQASPLEEWTEPAEHVPSVEASAEKKMLISQLKAAIARLPEPEKTVVINKELKGMKLQETADRLGMSVRTVSRRLLSAYDLLQKDLASKGITPELFGNSP